MSQDLTRWIEDADARRFGQTMMVDCHADTGLPRHYLHLGDAIAHLPSWFRHGVSRDFLAAIGCHAIAHLPIKQP